MLQLKSIDNKEDKPIISLVGLSFTPKAKTKKANSNPKKRKSKYRTFEDKDEVLNIYNEERVNLTPFIRDKSIHIVKGNTPIHYKEARELSSEYYEIFFEIFNELKEHIGYGVQIR